LPLPAFASAQERPAPQHRPQITPVYAVYRHIDTGPFEEPMGVFFDRRTEEVLVADTKNNVIAIFNGEGEPIFSFDGVEEPRKVMVDEKARVYVIDNEMAKGVKIFSYRGEFHGFFTFPGLNGLGRVSPVSMTVDREGNLYFLDQNNLRVLVYDKAGNFKVSFGKGGRGRGEFSVLADVAVDARGNIYVTDQRGVAVQAFGPSGAFLMGWGGHTFERHQFSLPNGIAIDPKGRILVADTLRQDVKIFDRTGRFLGRFGGFGVGPGDVAYPIELEVDDRGRIYLVEKVGGRLQVFQEQEVDRKPMERR
jgi:DNA-binding beta-propeller fold protein YncE